MRPLLLLLSTVLLVAACPSDPPPPPPKPAPPPPPAAPEPPPPEPEPEPEEPEPEPEPDPPGTLYNWEDKSGQIHVTQTPPPVGARLISKELPRGYLTGQPSPSPSPSPTPNPAPNPNPTAAPNPNPTPAPSPTPRADADALLADALVDEINRVRRNPFAYAAEIERAPGGEEAAAALRKGRRRMVALRRETLADEVAVTRKMPRSTKNGHHLIAGRAPARQMVEQMMRRPAERTILVAASARVIGVRCSPDCAIFIADGIAR